MDANTEINHLLDLMPASGRMVCQVIARPAQSAVITAQLPRPWEGRRPIYINFDLWQQLSRSQRDLLFLRTVQWLTQVRWVRVDVDQGLMAAGALGALIELWQGDAVGTLTAAGLVVLAGTRLWYSNRSPKRELEADEAALQVASRRGYDLPEAAQALLSAIETTAKLERRLTKLTYSELLRSQNLKAIAGLSPLGVPESLRRRDSSPQ